MKIDEIDKYLAGEMTDEERALFEKEMEHDAKLREDVRIIAFIIHGIKQVGLEEDNQRLQRLIASSASDKQRYIATIAAIFIAGFIIAATISVPIYNHVVKPLIEKVSKKVDEDTELWCICEMAKMYMQGVRPVYPVKRPGEWELRGEKYYCSECGEEAINLESEPDVYSSSYCLTNYCPNCGADMRGEEKGE